MRDSAHCRSQNAAAKHAKERGLPVKQTTLGTLLAPSEKRGATYPRLDTIESVAKLFNVSITALLSENLGKAIATIEKPRIYAEQEKDSPTYIADPVIAETVALMGNTNQIGRAIVHDKARDIAKEHPVVSENAA